VDDILSLYKKELRELYRANKNPAINGLLKPVALSLARINYRLNDSYAELSDKMLEKLWPAIVKPIPSVGMVQLEGLSENTIQQGSLLKALSDAGRSYYFKTVYPVKLYPIHIKTIQFLNKKSDLSLLKIHCCFHEKFKHKDLFNSPLRFYINTNFKAASILYELLFNQIDTISIKIHNDANSYNSNHNSITKVGLNLNESLLFDLQPLIPADQLIVDFFAYSKKFLFFDLNLSKFNMQLPFKSNAFDLLFYFTRSSTLLSTHIKDKSLLLNCTPIINLFDHVSEYIKFDQKHNDYKVIPQKQGNDENYNIYDVTEVWQIDTNGDTTKIRPFDGSNSTTSDANLCWSVRKYVLGKRLAQEMRLVILGYHKYQDIEVGYIKAKLLCRNKMIEEKLSHENFELIHDDDSVKVTEVLDRFSPPFLFEAIEDNWHFIALLSTATSQLLNATDQLSLLKKIINIIPMKKKTKRSLFLDSIVSFNITKMNHLIAKKNMTYYIQGLSVSFVFDDIKVNWAEFFLFWQVLKEFFSIKYSIYAPISFSLLGNSSQEKASCVFSPHQ